MLNMSLYVVLNVSGRWGSSPTASAALLVEKQDQVQTCLYGLLQDFFFIRVALLGIPNYMLSKSLHYCYKPWCTVISISPNAYYQTQVHVPHIMYNFLYYRTPVFFTLSYWSLSLPFYSSSHSVHRSSSFLVHIPCTLRHFQFHLAQFHTLSPQPLNCTSHHFHFNNPI